MYLHMRTEGRFDCRHVVGPVILWDEMSWDGMGCHGIGQDVMVWDRKVWDGVR